LFISALLVIASFSSLITLLRRGEKNRKGGGKAVLEVKKRFGGGKYEETEEIT